MTFNRTMTDNRTPTRPFDRSTTTCSRAFLMRCACAALAMIGMLASQAAAVTIVLKDGGETIRGILVRKSPTGVTIDVVQSDGEKKRREISMSQIELILDPIKKERLEELNRDRPQSYRDYAEELAEKKSDPDARAMAIRLYLIAAQLAPADLGKSSLLGMAALARNETEQRRFRAMVYLLDERHDKRLLQTAPSKPPTASAPVTDAATARVVQALQKLRRGQMKEARVLSRREGFAGVLLNHNHLLTMAEFNDAANLRCPQCQRGQEKCPRCTGSGRVAGRACPPCRGRKQIPCQRCGGNYTEPPIPDRLLRKVVMLELELQGEPDLVRGGMSADGDEAPPWSKLIRDRQTRPAPSLQLETITEFDPRKNVYRNGDWHTSD